MYYFGTHNIFVYYLLSLYRVDMYCVVLSLTLHHKISTLRDPTSQTTDWDAHSADPRYFHEVASPLNRVVTEWAHYYSQLNKRSHLQLVP